MNFMVILRPCTFCVLQGKGGGLPVERSGLHDNWDDAEGYYSKSCSNSFILIFFQVSIIPI